MSTSPFNTLSETGNRLIVCLAMIFEPKDIDEITKLDLVATYGASFGYKIPNLHGDNPFAHLEFSARRQRVYQALLELVKLGYAQTGDSGITFSATTNAVEFCNALTSDYFNEYCASIYAQLNRLGNSNSAFLYLDENGNTHE